MVGQIINFKTQTYFEVMRIPSVYPVKMAKSILTGSRGDKVGVSGDVKIVR